jgi:antitoxin component of RelBE/YafQ-DinJ toxin-antitoxin module
MSKSTLNLSIAEPIKRRAKRIAKQRGLSVSRFFENLVAEQDDSEDWKPPKGSVGEKLLNIIPESERLDDFDYKKQKLKVLKEKYHVEENTH